jgi:protein tyrosine/serine phosphatase
MQQFDVTNPWGRAKAYAWLWIVDYGFLRGLGFDNFHRVSDRAFRSGQPSPGQLARQVRRFGIRTVINLRGYDPASAPLALEEDTCRRLGVRLEHFKMLSRELPTPEKLHQARALLQDIEYPALFHCKSGADRAGLFSTLYLHWIEGVPLNETRQLRLIPYRHFRYAKTGLLDFLFESYERYAREHPVDLLTWVDTAYDRESLRRQFRPLPAVDMLVDRILKRE